MTCPHCGRPSASPSTNLCGQALKGQICAAPGALTASQQWGRIEQYAQHMPSETREFWLNMVREYGNACAREAETKNAGVAAILSDIVEEFRKYPNRPSRAMMAAITRGSALLSKG